MTTILAFFLSLSSIVNHTTTCETYGARLDGSKVTVCEGKVMKVTDVNGTVYETGKY